MAQIALVLALLTTCVSVHATNFAVLLEGGEGKGSVCSSKARNYSKYGMLYEIVENDLLEARRRADVGPSDNQRVRLIENGELDFDADGDFDACFTNNEVTGCDTNCTVRVPIRNDGSVTITIERVSLFCVDGNGEVIGANPYISTDSEKRRRAQALGNADASHRTRNQFDIELTVGKGRGYRSAEDNAQPSWGFYPKGNQAAGTRVRKGMQDLKVVSFLGEYQYEEAFNEDIVISCPEGADITMGEEPTEIPPFSEVLVEVQASIPESVRVVVAAQTTDNATSYASLDLVSTSVVDLLNMPFLCCLSSVRQRASLGARLAEALQAYQNEDPNTALEILRWFINYAQTAECDATNDESACLQEAVAAAIAAARMISEQYGQPGLERYGDLADSLRRRNQPQAAALAYRKKNNKARTTLSMDVKDSGNFGFLEITRG